MRFCLPFLLLLAARALGAQPPASDSARLVVLQDGSPVGTEDFAFRTTAGADGPALSFVAATTGGPVPLRMAVTTDPRRITVRVAAGSSEAAREYPGGSRAVVADERVLSLYALLAHVDPGPVTVYGPPPGGRSSGTLQEDGTDPPTGGPARTRRLTLRSGEDVAHVWLDPDGRLVRVAIPSRSLVAERVIRP